MAIDLERWLDTWRGPLVGLIAAWGVPWGEAAGIAEEVFAQAWLARERFRGDPADPRVAGPWLRGIARNVHRGWSRERERAARRAELEPDALAAPAVEVDERVALLRAELARLPEPLREAVCAHHLEGAPVRQVAGLLGVSEKTVEGRLHRARRELRRRLEAAERAQEVRR